MAGRVSDEGAWDRLGRELVCVEIQDIRRAPEGEEVADVVVVAMPAAKGAETVGELIGGPDVQEMASCLEGIWPERVPEAATPEE